MYTPSRPSSRPSCWHQRKYSLSKVGERSGSEGTCCGALVSSTGARLRFLCFVTKAELEAIAPSEEVSGRRTAETGLGEEPAGHGLRTNDAGVGALCV
jgi:hypothetical protein